MTMHSGIEQYIALVVDDDPDSLTMVSSALEENGMTVIVARDGQTAIDLVGRIEPDVILMDAIMPRMDGFETCRRIKTDANLPDAPIVFMTGLTDAEDVVRGLNSGGVDYITKPVIIDELIARIGIHIVNSNMIKSARDALDVSGRSLLAFDRQGKLAWGSGKAIKALPPETLAKSQMQAWLIESARKPVSQVMPMTIDDVAFVFVGLSASNEILVKFKRSNMESGEHLLSRTFALTAREAEVLYWLSLGKTNRDISTILTLSPRTVNKHLEQVFQKMGVDNRTSAAVAADRILHSLR